MPECQAPVCAVCKQPIGLRISQVGPNTFTHPGQCEDYYREQAERLTESETSDVIAETQIL